MENQTTSLEERRVAALEKIASGIEVVGLIIAILGATIVLALFATQ